MPSTPSNEEQLLLELINRFRTNPAQEAALLTTNPPKDIADAIAYFGVSTSALATQLAALTPVAPLAWNGNLADAADGHNAAMIAADLQSHQVPGEPDLGVRATNAQYTNYSSLGENIYLYAENALNAHAAFIIDWGYDTQDFDPGSSTPRSDFATRGDGMQDPPGHRVNLINGSFTEVGLSMVAENNPNTEAGPVSVTQDLGTRFGYQAQFVGVVINDTDHDHFYDVGEGLSGVTVTLQSGSNTYSTTTWSSGGYQITVPAGTYTLTFSGGALTAPVVKMATLGNANVEVVAEAGGVSIRRVDHDFNGDGRSDILWRNGTTGQMGDWLANSSGNFAANATLYSVTTDWKIAGTGDFNGDGKGDILWRNADGRFGDWFGNSSGNFAANSTIYSAGNDWSIVGTGDFNGDGRTDILWRHADGRVGSWSADANGNFGANASLYPVDTAWKIAGTGDFNGDGRADILWRNTTTGQTGDWFGNANGTFTANATLAASPLNWHIAETGDFNGDGRTDIVWRSDSGQVGDWLADANGNFTANATLSSAPVDWKIAETGDFNGDGRADLLWRNTTTGQVGDWFADANGNFTPNPTLANAPTDWSIFSDHPFLV